VCRFKLVVGILKWCFDALQISFIFSMRENFKCMALSFEDLWLKNKYVHTGFTSCLTST
jgi:hypothetical protein